MRPFFTDIAGNRALRERIGSDIVSGTLGQAFILSGPAGSGRKTFARAIAMALSCASRTDDSVPLPCGSCLSCRQIREGISPDLYFIRREEKKATIGVDAIRAIRPSLLMTPVNGPVKVYVFEEADLMTPEAQNALLLTLENPPPYALFLLLCESPEQLLPTIRSRAPLLRMEHLDRETVTEYLLSHSPEARSLTRSDPNALDATILRADGCIGEVLSHLDAKSREKLTAQRERTLAFLDALVARRGQTSVEFLKSMGTDRAAALSLFSLFEEALRDCVLIRHADEPALSFFTSGDEAFRYAGRSSEKLFLRALDATQNAVESLLANANVRLALHVWAMDCGLL